MLTGCWERCRGTGWHRCGGRGGVRSRVDDHDAWEETSWGEWSGRGRKEHAGNRCDDHRTRIRGDDDGIEFGEGGSRWGLEKREVELVRDHIADDLAYGRDRSWTGSDKATDGGGRGTFCRVVWRGAIAKLWGCGAGPWGKCEMWEALEKGGSREERANKTCQNARRRVLMWESEGRELRLNAGSVGG